MQAPAHRLKDFRELTMWVTIGESFASPAALWMVETREKIVSSSAAAIAAPSGVAAGDLDAIMERCATGDDRAFDELYRRGAPRVRGFLIRLSGDAALADDLTQETFVRFSAQRVARPSTVESRERSLMWLAIARNAFLDHARREQVRRSSSSKLAQPREAAKDTQGDELLAGREMLDVVRETLDKLPMLQRDAQLSSSDSRASASARQRRSSAPPRRR